MPTLLGQEGEAEGGLDVEIEFRDFRQGEIQ